MNWLLIVFISGNFSFVQIHAEEEVCTGFGDWYVSMAESSSYACINSKKFDLGE